MFRWHCPFTLPEPFVDLLRDSGGIRWDPAPGPHTAETAPLLLLYPAPHSALEESAELLSGYRELAKLAPQGCLLHVERLRSLPLDSWSGEKLAAPGQLSTTANQPAPREPASLEQPEPLIALVTLALLRDRSAILDAYLDLELAGELVASRPDTDYLGRLRQASGIERLLSALRTREDDRERLFEGKRLGEEVNRQMEERQREFEELKQTSQTAYSELEKLFLSEQQHLKEVKRLAEERDREREEALRERDALERQATERDQAHLKERASLSREMEGLRLELRERQGELGQRQREFEELRQTLQTAQRELEKLFLSEQQRLKEVERLSTEQHSLRLQISAISEQISDERSAHGLTRARLQQLEAEREQERAALEQQMAERQNLQQQEVEAASQESSRLLLELHSTEEELEHHYRESLHGRMLVEAQEQQIQRSLNLLHRMAVVKQLPAVGPMPAPIQLLALLEGYRHSLKRAERLLRGSTEGGGGRFSR